MERGGGPDAARFPRENSHSSTQIHPIPGPPKPPHPVDAGGEPGDARGPPRRRSHSAHLCHPEPTTARHRSARVHSSSHDRRGGPDPRERASGRRAAPARPRPYVSASGDSRSRVARARGRRTYAPPPPPHASPARADSSVQARRGPRASVACARRFALPRGARRTLLCPGRPGTDAQEVGSYWNEEIEEIEEGPGCAASRDALPQASGWRALGPYRPGISVLESVGGLSRAALRPAPRSVLPRPAKRLRPRSA